MSIDLMSFPAVINLAFEILYSDVFLMMPSLASLPLDTELWQCAMEKLIERYMLGIRVPVDLAEHGKRIFPTGALNKLTSPWLNILYLEDIDVHSAPVICKRG